MYRQLVLHRELVPMMRVKALKLTRYLNEQGPAAAINVEVASTVLPAPNVEAELLASVSDSTFWALIWMKPFSISRCVHCIL